MFDLPYARKLPEKPDSPPELTLREKMDLDEAKRFKELRIEDEIYTRMRDRDTVLESILVCLRDSQLTQNTLVDLLLQEGDARINIGNLRCDVRAHITWQVQKDAERGRFYELRKRRCVDYRDVPCSALDFRGLNEFSKTSR